MWFFSSIRGDRNDDSYSAQLYSVLSGMPSNGETLKMLVCVWGKSGEEGEVYLAEKSARWELISTHDEERR